MAGFDRPTLSYSNQQRLVQEDEQEEDPLNKAQERLREFIRNFRDGETFVYLDTLNDNIRKGNYFLNVNISDLTAYDEKLKNLLMQSPAQVMPKFDAAAYEIAVRGVENPQFDSIQILLSWREPVLQPLRAIQPTLVSHIVCIHGICISATRVKAKARTIHVICSNCSDQIDLPVKEGLAGVELPRTCRRQDLAGVADEGMAALGLNRRCPVDPYRVVPDKSTFYDMQTIKMQEYLSDAPAGDMPRHVQLVLDRNHVDRMVPGTRAMVIGVHSVFDAPGRSGQAERSNYIQVLGIQHEAEAGISGGASRGEQATFTPDEEDEFSGLAKMPGIYDKFAESLAPSIYGHDDIKKSLVLQLFGAPRVKLPDGPNLRGDIHVLLLGDPGTAKSQLLKFAERVSPVAVYTSGKGSSAAGLTASVVRDSASRDFYLEGGAMVLSDGGVCCIDEFDKMAEQDRVAIHEAMEQQTISIAKAGITTILNSRTAVLAAANPTFGRFRDDKSAAENIEFEATILSRFDVIFLVRDDLSSDVDQRIAIHVLNTHSSAVEDVPESEFPLHKMKRFIQYCRVRFQPQISDGKTAIEDAKNSLVDKYAQLRDAAGRSVNPKDGKVIPITVRQLQGVMRMSVAHARIHGREKVIADDVDEAYRLFQLSTQQAASSGIGGRLTPETVNDIEKTLRQNLHIGGSMQYTECVKRLVERTQFKHDTVRAAISALERRNVLSVTGIKSGNVARVKLLS